MLADYRVNFEFNSTENGVFLFRKTEVFTGNEETYFPDITDTVSKFDAGRIVISTCRISEKTFHTALSSIESAKDNDRDKINAISYLRSSVNFFHNIEPNGEVSIFLKDCKDIIDFFWELTPQNCKKVENFD